jgi:hypothetical protein
MQGRRMELPGVPRAIVVFDALQYPLARALIAERREAELWYGGERPERGALRILHEAATDRAALTFSLAPLAGEERARDRTHALYERMEALGIESGRLGSERTR